MKYDFILSLIFYICGCFYMVFGVYAIAASAKSRPNRLFLILTSSMAIWALAYSISNSAPTADASAYWSAFSVFGWGVFYSHLLRFVLILTQNKSWFNQKRNYLILYVPAVMNIVLFSPVGLLSEKHYKMVWTEFGWVNRAPMSIGGAWLAFYYVSFSVVSFILLIRWWRTIESRTPLKRHVTYFLISVLIPFILGFFTDILPDILQYQPFPKVTIVFFIIPTATLYLALKNAGLILEKRRETPSFSESEKFPSSDRMRLFQTASAIFVVSAAISFLIGFFGMKGVLEDELTLAAFILLIGILTRFIPYIAKTYATQNTIFLAMCMLVMLFFILTSIATAAVTIWSVYILFLLFTVILDSRIHAFAFILINVGFQLIFWIIQPRTVVMIDGNEYVTRIFIMMLSYFAVRYLTNEYAQKMHGYKVFAKGQEILEKISSNFISVSSENAREKIDEMFEMAIAILEYNRACLIEFSADYKDANILNMYVKDAAVESSPYCPGMSVQVAASPIAKLIIAQKQLVICEDITNFPAAEGEEKAFFMSRSVASFFAFPIMADQELKGMLVVSYDKRMDVNTRENRLHFLKIIANILEDTKKKILYEEMLYRAAYFDEGTKLANRNMLKKNLEQMLHNRNESDRLAILHIELDNLKTINDTFGQRIGDYIIGESAAMIDNLVKQYGDVSRISEGAFIAVIPFRENTEWIEACAQKIIDSFSQPISTESGIEAVFAVVNIGISLYPDDGRDVDTLVKNANLAGHEAKNAANRIVFCTEQLKNRVEENALFTNRLFQALDKKEFFLEFQPQISCQTGKTVGVEALLRWPTAGSPRIAPDKFIPILEQTGLIHDVGYWVLEQTLQAQKRFVAKGFAPLRFSVNISVVQLQRDNFVTVVSKMIKEQQANPEYIELEITESMLSQNLSETVDKLFQLKELGVHIVIDDFGRGYSSLHRLDTVPFDKIKIDKSIIDNIALRRKNLIISRTIVSLAKTLGASVTAEGVETKELAEFLIALGCDEIQGYYYSRPLSCEALEEYLRNE